MNIRPAKKILTLLDQHRIMPDCNAQASPTMRLYESYFLRT
jgi:hypothetical protein